MAAFCNWHPPGLRHQPAEGLLTSGADNADMETPENDVGIDQINPSRQRVWRRSSSHRHMQITTATLALSGIPHNGFFTKRAVLAFLGSNWTCISLRGINGNQTFSGRTQPWSYDTAAESGLTAVAISLKIIFLHRLHDIWARSNRRTDLFGL